VKPKEYLKILPNRPNIVEKNKITFIYFVEKFALSTSFKSKSFSLSG
jgi:hypothetical protein